MISAQSGVSAVGNIISNVSLRVIFFSGENSPSSAKTGKLSRLITTRHAIVIDHFPRIIKTSTRCC